MKIAYIAPEFGTLTSTFVYREVEALRKRGYAVATFSTIRPKEQVVSEEARQCIAQTDYLYDRSPGRILLETLDAFRRSPLRWLQTFGTVLADSLTATVPQPVDRLKLLWQFCIGAAFAVQLLRAGAQHVHAHFAHVPTTITMYAALITGIPFSFTCHANDIFERGTALRQKVRRAAFAACISEFNRRHLTEIGCDASRLHIVRCALDLSEYAYRQPLPLRTPPTLFSVGRLVEKKGLRHLVEAVQLLRERGCPVRVRIAGDGPLMRELRAQIDANGLVGSVELMGSQPQERVRDLIREADIFVLPCVVARSGDQDGIPVALMEAMAIGVPVVSTRVSGIPELIQNGHSGLITAPGDAGELAESLQRLIGDEALRIACSRAGRAVMEREFEEGLNAERLATLFEGGTPAPANPHATVRSHV
jgi:colanic acid/amylovoran biosynthesis glycosyltransferase